MGKVLQLKTLFSQAQASQQKAGAEDVVVAKGLLLLPTQDPLDSEFSHLGTGGEP